MIVPSENARLATLWLAVLLGGVALVIARRRAAAAEAAAEAALAGPA